MKQLNDFFSRKYIFFLTIFFSSRIFGFSQDIIIKVTGEEIQTKVSEITTEFIKYRNFSQPSGPIRNVRTDEVFIIIYENGSREVIKKPSYTPANSEVVQTAVVSVNKNTRDIDKNSDTDLKPVENLNPVAMKNLATDNDIVVKLNGEQIFCIVIEITPDFLKYHKPEQPNGPIRNISCKEVHYIQYKGGSKEIINKKTGIIESPPVDENTYINEKDVTVDVILKSNGESLKEDIIEITAVEIKYKLPNQFQGPEFSIPISECSSILYKDGSREKIGNGNTQKKNLTTNESQEGKQDIDQCGQDLNFVKEILGNQMKLLLGFNYNYLNINDLMVQSYLQDNLDLNTIITNPENLNQCGRNLEFDISHHFEPKLEEKLNTLLSRKWVKVSRSHASSNYEVEISVTDIRLGEGFGPPFISSLVKIIDVNSKKCIYQFEIINSSTTLTYIVRPNSVELLSDAFSSLGRMIGKYMIKNFY